MPLFDIFKRKKKTPEKIIEKKEEIEEEKKLSELDKEKPKKGKRRILRKRKKKISKIASGILVSPHVTEKATDLEAENKYVFKVFKNANKIEIKKAIEQVYGVKVLGVNIINIPRKKRRLGRTSGWKKGFKKAIVKIKEGQKIEVISR